MRGGLDRLARPDKYVILWDGQRFEVPFNEVKRLAEEN